MTLGEKIRTHRKALGLTQAELGEKLGVKLNAVSKWECGRVEAIPTSKIKALANLFNVPPSYLIDDEKEVLTDASEDEAALDAEIIKRLIRLTPDELKTVDAFVQGILTKHST